MAFECFRSDLSEGQLTGRLVDADTGDVLDIPPGSWEAGTFALALWSGETAKISVCDKDHRGRLVFEISELERYLSARDGRSWRFCRDGFFVKLTKVEDDPDNEALSEGFRDSDAIEGERLPPYLNYMLRIWRDLNLKPDVWEKKEWLEEYIRANWPSEFGKPSDSKVSYMATFVRDPRYEVGGNRGRRARGIEQKALAAPLQEGPTL